MQRMITGALAGVVATMAMTMAMRRLHRHLSDEKRYPLPPREIIDRMMVEGNEKHARTNTLAAHFGFGALTGAIFAYLKPNCRSGPLYGVGVWLLSYFGWVPAARILAPAWRHPAERNLLMIVAHLVWGATLAKSLDELEAANSEIFGRAPRQRGFRERKEMEPLR